MIMRIFSWFSKKDEKLYIRKKLREGRFSLRILLFVFAILYGAFGFLDILLTGENMPIFIFIRFGLVIPFLLFVIAITYHDIFYKIGQQILLSSFILTGSGISYMLILLPENISYYGGAFMIIFSGYFLVKLNTEYAILGGIINLVIFISGYAVAHGELQTSIWVFVAFMFGSNIIGAIGNYQLEKNGRILYQQDQEIQEKNRQLKSQVNEQRKELVQVEKAVESASDAITIYNSNGELTYCNKAYNMLISSSDLFDDSKYFNKELFLDNSNNNGSWKDELNITKKDGHPIVLLLQADVVRENNGKIIGFIKTYKDITERKKAEKEIEYLSFHDALTDLYNRRYFDEELKRINVSRNLPLSLIILDVNGLKLTNDAFGHQFGDELLIKVAHVLKETCRADDIIARIGGDEFAILLPQTDKDQTREVINRIKQAISLKKVEDIPLSVSCGCGTKNNEQEYIADVFKSAEDDMYRSKTSERRSYRHKTIDIIMQTLYAKSPREQAHSQRVSKLCGEIASFMGLDADELTTAGILHDIGKVAISERVLDKKTPLTDSEWMMVKKHPEAGYNILSSATEYGLLAEYVISHHEHFDGSGYPNGLQGEKIPIPARIISIADAYDAMISDRPYRKGMSHSEAIKEIETNAGSQFDPEIANVFINLMEDRKRQKNRLFDRKNT